MRGLKTLLVWQLLAVLAWTHPLENREIQVTVASETMSGHIQVSLHPAPDGATTETSLTFGEPKTYKSPVSEDEYREFWDSKSLSLALTRMPEWDEAARSSLKAKDPFAPLITIDVKEGNAPGHYILREDAGAGTSEFLGWLFHSSIIGEQLNELPESARLGIVDQFLSRLDEL